MKKNMKIAAVLTSLVLWVSACAGDKDLKPFAQTIKGNVGLGSPVVGATVSVYEYRHLKQGRLLGTATTDEKGNFEIPNKTPVKGPRLVVSQFGHYVDPTTKIKMYIPDSFQLRSVMSEYQDDREQTGVRTYTNVNLLSTLVAARLAKEDSQLREASKQWRESDDETVALISRAAVSVYFGPRVEPNNSVVFKYQDAIPWEPTIEKLGPNEDRVWIYLLHAGISQMAKDFTTFLKLEPGAITPIHLIEVLARDAEDGLFDGKYKLEQLYVDAEQKIPVDSYFLRNKLAISIQRFVTLSKDYGFELGFEGKNYAVNNGAYQRISAGKPMEEYKMFPDSEPGIPFDITGPKIMHGFGGRFKGDYTLGRVEGNIEMQFKATDSGVGLKYFKILEPTNLEIKSEGPGSLSLMITTSTMPQAEKAREACGFTHWEMYSAYGSNNVSEPVAPMVCVCAEAADFLNNVTRDRLCVRRPEPKFERTDHLGGKTIGSDAFNKTDDSTIKAFIKSGWALFTCGWQVQLASRPEDSSEPNVVGDVQLPWGYGMINPEHPEECTISAQLDRSKLPDGEYRIDLFARDILGNSAQNVWKEPLKSFKVFQTVPVVEVTSPEAIFKTNGTLIEIRGNITGADIRELYAEVQKGSWNDSNESTKYFGVATDGKWGIRIENLNQELLYSYVIHAVDIYGNRSKLPARAILIDRTPPSIIGHREGLVQPFYAQERSNVRVLREGIPGMDGFEFKANGLKQKVAWENVPVFYRWAGHEADASTAPTYRVGISDIGAGVKEVRYAHGVNCVESSGTKAVAIVQDGNADLKIDAASSLDPLNNKSDSDRCLSVWATDGAGNSVGYNVSFKWKTVAPPLVFDLSSKVYEPSQHIDDMSYFNLNIDEVYNLSKNARDSDGYVVAHALVHNPHDIDLGILIDSASDPKLELKLNETMSKVSDEDKWFYKENGQKIALETHLEADPNQRAPDNAKRGPFQANKRPDWVAVHPVTSYVKLATPYDPSAQKFSGKTTFKETCPTSRPLYSKICKRDEIAVVVGDGNPDGGQCPVKNVECLPGNHHYSAVFKDGESSMDVGQVLRAKNTTLVKSAPKFFRFDSKTNEIGVEEKPDKGRVDIAKGKSLLLKWFIKEDVREGLGQALKGRPTLGKCNDVFRFEGTSHKLERYTVCTSLSGLQARMDAKAQPVKNGAKSLKIKSESIEAPIWYTTKTGLDVESDESIPVTYEQPLTRTVLK